MKNKLMDKTKNFINLRKRKRRKEWRISSEATLQRINLSKLPDCLDIKLAAFTNYSLSLSFYLSANY